MCAEESVPGPSHMAAICEVSEVEIQREKKLLDRRWVERGRDGSRDLERDSERREERERGKSNMGLAMSEPSCSIGGNVYLVFY